MIDENKLSPMMQHYIETKKKYEDCILFYRLGDFYEMFSDDALLVAPLLGIALTKKGTEPMCGVPYHSYLIYVDRLLQKGYKNDLLSYRLRFPDKYLPALLNAKGFGRYSENKAKYRKGSAMFGHDQFGTLDGCSDLNYETSYESMHTTGDAVLLDVYVNRLLSLCEKEGINTTVSIPPMNKSSYNELNASYTEDLYYYFEALKSKYKNIEIESNIPVYDDKYFGDSSHLNREGALIFTKEFLSTY